MCDKESWLLKYGTLETESSSTGYFVKWKSNHEVRIRVAHGKAYFDAINTLYENVKNGVWFIINTC